MNQKGDVVMKDNNNQKQIMKKEGGESSIGQRLRKIRKDNNLTEVKLAERFGIHKNTVIAYETKKVPPMKIETLEKYCRLGRVSADYILFGEDTLDSDLINELKRFGAVDKRKLFQILDLINEIILHRK